jgi:dephospho-CoA kinase
MDLETSIEFDFRAKAVIELIDRLAEYAAVLNFPPAAYRRRGRSQGSDQSSLFEAARKPIVVIGRTCAGKTTLADRAGINYERSHVEASSVVRLLVRRGATSSGEALESAQSLLQERGPDVVAREILDLYEPAMNEGPVITGFRTIEELLRICGAMPDTRVVWVEASERTRFARNLERGRYPDADTIEAFRQLDEGQMSLGLLRVAEDLVDVIIINEDSLAEYYASVDSFLEESTASSSGMIKYLPRFETRRERSQLYRCLRILVGQSALTSREISERMKSRRIATRNVNMTLKAVPELARRYGGSGDEFRYEVTPSGAAYVQFMELRGRG